MRKLNDRLTEVRLEAVTSGFVAAGIPEGVHDLGRLLENLNNPAISRQIELGSASVRPLYSATAQTPLEAPLLVRREEIIFANFEGPFFSRSAVRPPSIDVPVLLMVPPFQISGMLAVAQDAEVTQSMRTTAQGFFTVRNARVFDVEGASLGEGEQIVVNGAAVQMMSATRQHIAAIGAVSRRDEQDAAIEPRQEQARAA